MYAIRSYYVHIDAKLHRMAARLRHLILGQSKFEQARPQHDADLRLHQSYNFV